MTYWAFIPNEAKIAGAVSRHLETWQRLGVLRNAEAKTVRAFQPVENKMPRFSRSPYSIRAGYDPLRSCIDRQLELRQLDATFAIGERAAVSGFTPYL